MPTINKRYGLSDESWKFSFSNTFAEAFASASKKDKFITKTKASAK